MKARQRHYIPIKRVGGVLGWAVMLAACGAPNGDGEGVLDVQGAQSAPVAEGVVELSESQRALVGVRTEVLAPRALPNVIRAPGEAALNGYATTQVTPRIEAQVVARHARLGDHVDEGQALVTLSSVAMADAQGSLIVTDREWRRVRNLGREVVSERRFVEAEVAAQQARATARAYGLTPAQIDELLTSGDADHADGRFTLLAPQQGTIIRDDFVVGEMIAPGRVLFAVTDESTRWVEARLSPRAASRISTGDAARIRVADQWIDARVVQLYQAVDEATRTLPVRLEVPDPDKHLEPGLFVDVEIRAGAGEPVLALPDEAVLPTPDGDWEVFVESAPGEYRPAEVNLLDSAGGFARIEGLEAGVPVVVEGAFFLQSELGKSGFDVDDD